MFSSFSFSFPLSKINKFKKKKGNTPAYLLFSQKTEQRSSDLPQGPTVSQEQNKDKKLGQFILHSGLSEPLSDLPMIAY